MARDYGAFDLFAGLAALSKKGALGLSNTTWFDGLTPEGQKAAAPFVMMRWLSGTSDPAQIIRLNTVANRYMFAGSADKSSLFKLLAIGTSGKSSRYQWIKGPGSKAKKLAIECTMAYYECSMREAQTYRIDTDSLIEMAEELGWEKDEITKLKKELDDGSGVTTKASSKPAKPARGKRA
jgi:hypothetical protein